MKEYSPQVLSKEKMLEKAKLLPLLPGVYLFFDKSGSIIYVGKSKLLRNRVLSYFQNDGKHSPKTEKLVQTAADFQTIVTASEAEALILENEKIKLHQPKYNIRLKDDKSYPYIRLSLGEPYPRLSMARRRGAKKDGDKYFGPYSSSSAVHAIIDTANKLFRLPTCSRSFPKEIGKSRPCLYLQMNRCCGVCTGKISPEEYAAKIEQVILFLKNDYNRVIRELNAEMECAAEATEYEKAARLRDGIRALTKLSQNNQVVKDLSFDADVFGLFADECGGCINMLKVRGGSVCDSVNFHFGADEIVSPESFTSILVELYRGKEFFPKEIMLSEELYGEESAVLSELLRHSGEREIKLLCPERGDGRKIVRMAAENAKQAALHRRAVFEKDEEVLVKLAALLQLEVLPERIESIDVSNSGNSFITASIISIENARFCKRNYKSFHITLAGQDDFSSMYEAVSRRVARFRAGDEAFSPLPDLILADGGVGQVGAVRKALADQGVSINVFGMVKDEFHKTRCLTDGVNDISIAKDPRLFQFIFSIQEEVHRFTLSRMDSRRRKTVKTTSLTAIPGIGAKKANLLLRHYKSVKAVRKASIDELSSVKGISRRDAEAIFTFYKGKSFAENKKDEPS